MYAIRSYYAVCVSENFNWKDICAIADKKSPLNTVFFADRLLEFPLQWLDNIKYANEFSITEEMIGRIVEDVLNGRDRNNFV